MRQNPDTGPESGTTSSLPGVRRPLRGVTDEERETYARDGVVCLRSILDPEEVDALARPIDDLVRSGELADLTGIDADVRRAAGNASGPAFWAGTHHWRHHRAFADFALTGGLGGVVTSLLGTPSVQLYEDSVLIKEPGSGSRTRWHQDLGYFNAEGPDMCTTWVPLDPATPESGAMGFVVGSHRWGRLFQPNFFVTDSVIEGTEGEPVPDVEALIDAGEVKVIRFELGPGDLTVHHAATLHAAGPNTTDHRRRAISVRYCGPLTRMRIRPGVPLAPHHRGLADGQSLDPLAFPPVDSDAPQEPGPGSPL